MWLIGVKIIFPISVILCLATAAPIDDDDQTEMARAHLKKYFMGEDYENPAFGQIESAEEFAKTVSAYQLFMGLNVTGELDDDTIHLMETPRCGLGDLNKPLDDVKRKRRYTIQGNKWNNNSPLSWRFLGSTTPDLAYTQVLNTMHEAFRYWSDVADLTFTMINSGTPDIWVQFGSREHGDGPDAAFDGPSGTLAHAYFPGRGLGGDAHFDEDETWSLGTRLGTNLLQVAVHEIGHSLGLGHSGDRGAIMYPSYLGYVPNFSLGTDDIEGIQRIYGPRVQVTTRRFTTGGTQTTATTARTTTTPRIITRTPAPSSSSTTTTTTQPPDTGLRQQFCQNLHFDAVTQFGNKFYAFKDDLYAVLDNTGIAPGFPRYIADDFRGLQGISNLDAALFWQDRSPQRLYIFKDSQYWRYEMNSLGNPGLRSGYPRLIRNGFPGLPNNIDNAFVWSGNGRSYIFKGSVYYRLYKSPQSNLTRGNVDSGYPRSSSIWRLPEGSYDSISQWSNGRTYLFKNGQYSRVRDTYPYGIDATYPRSVDRYWTGCFPGNLEDGATDPPMEMEEHEDTEFNVIEQEDDDDGVGVQEDAQLTTSSSTSSDVIDSAHSIHQWAAPVLLLVVAALILS